MTSAWWPVFWALFSWWAGTVAVFLMSRLPASLKTPLACMTAASYLAMLIGILVLQTSGSPYAPYQSFSMAVVLWGSLEFSYFRGWITGPNHSACPPVGGTWARFKAGVGTSLHHELLVIATGAVLLVNAANHGALDTGTGSFLILWLMRWSAKLNLFLGVRNFNGDLLPRSMQYLNSYIRKAPFNALFPFSMVAAGAVVSVLVSGSLDPDATTTARSHGLLMATLLALAILEHALMFVPFSDRILWTWAAHGGKPTEGPR